MKGGADSGMEITDGCRPHLPNIVLMFCSRAHVFPTLLIKKKNLCRRLAEHAFFQEFRATLWLLRDFSISQ